MASDPTSYVIPVLLTNTSSIEPESFRLGMQLIVEIDSYNRKSVNT
jgi:hypothetical protein